MILDLNNTQPKYRDKVGYSLRYMRSWFASPKKATTDHLMMDILEKPYSGNLGRAEGVDISHWIDKFDPNLAKYRIDFAIMKITEGTNWTDPSIATLWNGVKQLAIRGAYHYYRSGMGWQAQADYFLSVANRYDFNILAIDVEGINNDLTNAFFIDVKKFYDYLVEKTGGKKRIIVYTNKNYFQNYMYPIYQSLGSEWTKWLDTVPFWYAQYYYTPSPDKYPSMPTQRSTWDIWQYNDAGYPSDWGTGGGTDLNVYNGTYQQMLDWVNADGSTPPVDPPSFDWQKSQYHDAIYHVHGWDLSLNFEYHISRVAWVNIVDIVTSAYKQFTNHYFLESRGVDLSINGDEYYYPGYDPVTTLTAKGITCVEGKWLQTRGWQAAQFDKENRFLGISTNMLPDTWNTYAGSQWLVQNGQPNTQVDDTSVDPRTILAGDDIYLYFISVMGRNNGSYGVTRRKMAYWMVENLNVEWAQNGDGGDSTSKNENDGNGKAINLILNPGDGIENSVGGHFGIIVKKDGVVDPPVQGDGMYKVLADVNIRKTPSMFAESIGVARAGSTFDSGTIIDGVAAPDGKTPNPMTFIGYANGYIPMEYDGVVYVEQLYDEVMTIKSGEMVVELPDGSTTTGVITTPVKLIVKQ